MKAFWYTLIILLSTFNSVRCQIYNKKIIYTFQYSHKTQTDFQSGNEYFGCFGKPWPYKKQFQWAVVWTSDIEFLKNKSFTTGAIEDSTRIWLHPPRHNNFEILEYSPFPEIKYPIEVGKQWEWQLKTGKNWINEELGVDADAIFKYVYEIKEVIYYLSPYLYQNIKCF